MSLKNLLASSKFYSITSDTMLSIFNLHSSHLLMSQVTLYALKPNDISSSTLKILMQVLLLLQVKFKSLSNPLLIINDDVSNSPFMIVLVGQMPIQALQLLHFVLSIEILLDTKLIASVGQISIHLEHSL